MLQLIRVSIICIHQIDDHWLLKINLLILSNLQHECETRMTRVRHKQHECNTSATRVRHECYTNDTSATRVKTYFHTLIFTIWQVKDYKEGNNFILSTTYWNVSFPCQNAFKKCTTKVKFLMEKATSESCTLDC